jgi:hypothetical protein
MMCKRKTLIVCLSLIIIGLLFCGSMPAFANGNSSSAGKSALKAAREGLERKLVGVPGFAGIAHSEKEGQITVFLENEHAKASVPDSFEGFPVRKELTGTFKALGTQLLEAPVSSQQAQATYDRLGVVRPLVGGVSVSALAGSRYIYAGTLGVVTYDNKILSNTHVLAMNPDDNSYLAQGTAVVQPGTLDGGFTSNNRVGELLSYIPIVYSKFWSPVANYADAAVASIDSGIGSISGAEVNEASDGYYTISGTTEVNENDLVEKSGRTTGYTTGTVAYTNASTWVDYGFGKRAYFVDQIFVGQPFIDSGDSGSAVDKDGSFVGLAFAGSSYYAIVCKARYIIDRLNISLTPAVANGSISGGVTDTTTGSAIPGATVTDGIRSTTTDSNGDYTISDVPPGTYTVIASANGYVSASQLVTLNEGSTATANFALVPIPASEQTVSVVSIDYATQGGKNKDQNLLITVALVDGNGGPVANASVSIDVNLNGSLYDSNTGTTGTDGTVTFRETKTPSGTYACVVTAVNAPGFTWDEVTPPNSYTK